MDDDELEARLRTNLHGRFDNEPVPAGLSGAVRQTLTAAPAARVGFSLRRGALHLGWAATALVVVVVGGFLLYGKVGLGPAGPNATPSPDATLAAGLDRAFVVLPKNGSRPSKADGEQAGAVFDARLGALGLHNFTAAIGYGYELFAPPDGPSDKEIHAVLAATGDVEFVPLPPDRYPN